jgi:chromosome segregation ATPase
MSSSSSAHSLQNQLSQIHQIAEESARSSSMAEKFRQQVNDLATCQKEVISLPSQLKIAKEACELQAAQFAFQRKQLEAELHESSARESELRQKLSQTTTRAVKGYKYDVEVKLQIERSKVVAAQERAQKWKQRCHDNRLKNDSLKAKLEEKEFEANKLAKRGQALRAKLEKEREMRGQEEQKAKTAQEEAIDLRKKEVLAQRDISRLTAENDGLKNDIENANADKERCDDEVDQLNRELRELKEKLARLSQETTSLNSQLRRARKDDEIAKLREALENQELEKQKLIEQLELVSTGEHENDWDSISMRVQGLMEQVKKCDTLEQTNERLRSKLKTTEDVLAELQSADDLGKEIAQLSERLRILRGRLRIANRAHQVQSEVISEIDDLYSLVCQEPSATLSPLILAVMFTRRLAAGIAPPDFDLLGFRHFPRRSSLSASNKLAQMRRRFTEMTQDLLLRNDPAIREPSSLSDEKLSQIAELLKRNEELEGQLNDSVPLDKYRQLEAELAQRVEEIDGLLGDAREWKHRAKQEQKQVQEIKAQCELMAKERNTEAQRADEFKAKFEAAQANVVALNALLRGRSKEMFALERFCHREHRRQSHSLTSLGCVVVENQNLRSELDGHKWKRMDRQRATGQINPAFLGDGYYS